MKNSLLFKCQALFATPSNKKNTTSFNGLLALFIMVMGMGVSWGQMSDLIISEYLEGSATNKYIEIYNGTGLDVNLSNYKLRLYANGSTSPTETTLSGTLINGQTIVYKNSASTVFSGISISSNTVINFNGDDAIALYNIALNSNIDIFGKIGEDPGAAWTGSGSYSTLDKTLVRKATIRSGISTNPISGFPTLSSEWDVFNVDTVSYLGQHKISSIWINSWSSSTPTSIVDAIINGDLTTSTDLNCKDLTINTGTTLTIGAGKKLTVSGNLINNGTIVFKSDATNTAMFDVFNGTQSGTGVVTVERYIPNKRAWRAITAPLKGSNASIFSQWQNNGSSVSNTGVELWGPGGTGSSGNGLAVGPSSSVMQYNAGAWNPITDTKNTNLFTTNGNNAFMIFPTGAYGSGNIANNTTAVATTLKATGQLITGNVPYTNLPDSNHTLIGNPYASPIDLNSILDANATLQKYFWVWDPNGANQGTYNMFDAIANTYTVTNLSYTNSSVIQSGQAFFVKAATGQTGSFTISENNKSTASTTNVFRNNTPAELFRVGLYKQVNNEWSGRDGAMTVLLSDADANQVPNKMANSTENIAFTKNGASFASNHHLPLVATDVLELKVWNTTAGSNYKLKFNTEAFTATHLAATLEDLYTNSRTSLNLNGSPVEYPFTVTNDALSTGNRFRIVFQNAVLGNNNPTTNGFSIVPNPVSGDSFQVNLGALATGTYSYSICNSIGQEVGNGTINSLTQNTNYEVKMSNAATGIYIMKIKGSDNSVYTAKIIKK